jgi:hypothetical protein
MESRTDPEFKVYLYSCRLFEEDSLVEEFLIQPEWVTISRIIPLLSTAGRCCKPNLLSYLSAQA